MLESARLGGHRLTIDLADLEHKECNGRGDERKQRAGGEIEAESKPKESFVLLEQRMLFRKSAGWRVSLQTKFHILFVPARFEIFPFACQEWQES